MTKRKVTPTYIPSQQLVFLLVVLLLQTSCQAFTLPSQQQQHVPATSTALRMNDGATNASDDDELSTTTSRRTFLDTSISAGFFLASSLYKPPASYAAATTTASPQLYEIPNPPYDKDLYWPLGKGAFSLLPLAGTSTRRATVEQEVVKNKIWTYDQLQGIVNVNVPVRQVVIKLSEASGGGLWVHNPVAPTPQLLQMMARLQEQHGPIRHIVLGTVALEHKATFGPFSQNFPNATVWIQPGQWAFPIDLNIQALGVTQRANQLREIPVPGRNVTSRIYYRKDSDQNPEWAADIEYETLGPLQFQSVGGFSETAFFHKSTKSLVVTDTVVSVTDTPPPIIQEDVRALLFHARDDIAEQIQDTPENRQRGWRRMVQFGLVFFPSEIDVVPFGEAISEAASLDKSMRNLGEGAVPFSLYPWTWHANNADNVNFQTISKNGKLFCPPILTKLILDREPSKTLKWVDTVCRRFPFERVITSHLNNNVKAGPKEFSAAFDPLRSSADGKGYNPQRPLPQDLALLQKASDLLTDLGVVGPSQVCDGELARQKGRFAASSKS